MGTKVIVYQTPSNRQTKLSDDCTTCVTLPPTLGHQEVGSKANPLLSLEDTGRMGEMEIPSTPVDLTSLTTAMRATKVEDSPPPMIPELFSSQEPCDFDRPSLALDHCVFPGRCRPSLRPKGEVARSTARRIEPAEAASRKRQQDRKLAALLRSLPEMPDSACLLEGERRYCPSLKPRLMLR